MYNEKEPNDLWLLQGTLLMITKVRRSMEAIWTAQDQSWVDMSSGVSSDIG